LLAAGAGGIENQRQLVAETLWRDRDIECMRKLAIENIAARPGSSEIPAAS
jgi:hypothetical protein